MMCEMCGKETNLFFTKIESTEMKVCEQCARYGKILKRVREEPIFKKKNPNKPIKIKEEEIIEMVVPNFASLIRKKRESLGHKQKDFAKMLNEKESRVHNIETGKFTPSLELARKLEKVLKINLIEEYKEEKDNQKKGESKSYTIGDMIKFK